MLRICRCYVRACKHYGGIDQPDGTEASEMHVCPAFPAEAGGIPEDICYGEELHLDPIQGQVGGEDGIVYEIDGTLTEDELVKRRMQGGYDTAG